MKAVLLALIISYSFDAAANPEVRSPRKMAPLLGKVRRVREAGVGATATETASTVFARGTYSVDTFSPAGLKLFTYWFFNGSLHETIEYRYDAKGKSTEKRIYDTGSNVLESSVFIYDTSGNLVEERISDFANKAVRTIKYTYMNGRVATKLLYDDQKTTYLYNGQGRLIAETISYVGGEGKSTTKYGYDEGGDIVLETDNWRRTRFWYDDHHSEIRAEEYTLDDSLLRTFTTEYVYDSHGNWIRRIESDPDQWGGEPFRKVHHLREIEYY